MQVLQNPRGIGALKDLQQTFPEPWLYVAELLQNAVDEGATKIAVTIWDDGSLVFEHDGNAFSAENVKALCEKGVSGKGANTVGFMGIGFKSVFRSYQSVKVSSGFWRFALTVPIRQGEVYDDKQRDWLGAVLPRWDGTAEAPSAGMKCRFALLDRLPDLPAPSDDLGQVVGDDEILLALLAWQGVKELDWNGKKWLLERHETPLVEKGDLRVLLEALKIWQLKGKDQLVKDEHLRLLLEALKTWRLNGEDAPVKEEELRTLLEAFKIWRSKGEETPPENDENLRVLLEAVNSCLLNLRSTPRGSRWRR